MARTHARLLCSIWNDPDWVALDFGAQWLYELLLSQGALNHAGVTGLTPRRWARGARDVTVCEVEKFLASLAEARFVVVDEETEELLIRAFVRRDGVADQPNVLKAALSDARQVVSSRLRAALAAELRRLPPKRDDTARMRYPDPHAVADEIDPDGPSGPPWKPSGDPYGEPFEKASDDTSVEGFAEPPRNPSAGVQETLDGTLPRSHGETPRGRGRGSSSGSVDENSPSEQTHSRASRSEPDGMDRFAEFYDAYPRRKDRLKAEKAFRAALRRGATADHLIAAARRYADETRHREARYVAHPTSWLNGGSYDNEPDPPRHLRAVSGGYQPYRNPTDDSVWDEPLMPRQENR